MTKLTSLIIIPLFIMVSCSSTEEETPAVVDATITISDAMVFSPLTTTVASGATIAILNEDSSSHTITSESSTDAFDDSGTFDTLVPASSSNTFTLPEAPSGTIYYYYCRFHEGAMATPTGMIEIE